jgi:hypothetical protein
MESIVGRTSVSWFANGSSGGIRDDNLRVREDARSVAETGEFTLFWKA